MTAATYNIVIQPGVAFTKTLTLKTPQGSPCNLTGFSAAMQFRLSPESPVLHTLSTTNGGIVLGGTAGTIALSIPAAVTARFTFSSAKHDLVLTAADGSKLPPILKGMVKVERMITQVGA